MLAMLTKSPLLQIDKQESDILGKGIANVARHYDVGGASEKTVDWLNLFQALAIVYGPRIFAVRQERIKKRESAPPKPSVTTPEQRAFDADPGGTPYDGNPARVVM